MEDRQDLLRPFYLFNKISRYTRTSKDSELELHQILYIYRYCDINMCDNARNHAINCVFIQNKCAKYNFYVRYGLTKLL